MVTSGVNYDLDHAGRLGRSWFVDLVAMADAGVKRVIMPLRADSPIEAFVAACHVRGILVRGVFDRTSSAQIPLVKWGLRLDSVLDEVQTGNEPDLAGEASWTMTQAECSGWLRLAEAAWTRPTLYAAFGSNRPSWAQRVTLGRHQISLHFYDMAIGTILADGYGDLVASLDAWAAAFPDQPLDIGELGVNRADVTLVRDYLYALPLLGIVPELCGLAWYCWGDWMEPQLGLTDVHGTPKGDLLAAYRAASEALDMATLEERVAQTERQQQLQTQALRRILEGKLRGADGAAADVVALEGGGTSVAVIDHCPFQ